jgi:hypothetical protein
MNIVKDKNRVLVFKDIIKEINMIAEQKGEFVLSVPFALIKAEKN